MSNFSLNYKASVIGRENRAAGEMFEALILAACRKYSAMEIADIDKTPEPFRIEKSVGKGKFIGHFAKKAQPDFKGVLKGGKAVVFEAKYTKTDRILQSVVSDVQYKVLDNCHKMGANCFVLVCFGFQSFYKIPWATFKGMSQKYGRKYIKPSDLTRYEVRVKSGALDFLEAIV